MATKLTIKNINSTASISIAINIAEAKQPIDFKNTAMLEVRNMDEAVLPAFPFLTYKAIEGACISGAIYARRKLGVSGLSIELLSFSWTGKVENVEPFAVATMIAACKTFPKAIIFSENELNGWHEVDNPV
jgi:hypothetical protein